MAGSERIVAIDVGESGQLTGELGIAFLFTLVESKILQQKNLTVLQRSGFRGSVSTDHR